MSSASGATPTTTATLVKAKPNPLPAHLIPFLIGLGMVAGLAELGYAIVNMSNLPVYLKSGLGLPVLVGAAVTAFAGSEAVFNSPMGTLADRLGRRRLMVGGAAISIATSLLATLIHISVRSKSHAVELSTIVLILRVFDGLGAAALWPAVFASIGDRVDNEHQSTAMGVLNVTYLLGIAFGPLIGGYVNQKYGMRFDEHTPMRYGPSFYAAAVCFAGAAIIGIFVAPSGKQVKERIARAREKGETRTDDAHTSALSFKAVSSALKQIPALMVLVFVTFMAVGLIAPVVKLFAMERYHLSELAYGQLFPKPALIVAALAIPMGRLGDIWGKRRAIQAGMATCALSLWLILVLKQEWSVVVIGAILGIGFVLAFPAYMALISELTGPEERGGVIGAVRMAQGFGLMMGAPLSSVLYENAGHLTPFICAAVLLTIAAFLGFVYVRDNMHIDSPVPETPVLDPAHSSIDA